MNTCDPFALLEATNPLPAQRVEALANAPERDAIRATIDRRRSHPIPPPSRRLAWRPTVLAAVVVAVLAVPALAISGVFSSLFGLANSGTTVTTSQLDLNDVQILEQDQVDVGGGIKLLATRDGQALYASRTTDGRTCLLNGPAGGTAPTQILIGTPCEADFPSATHPLLGQYMLFCRKPCYVQSVYLLEGLAADGIATVEAIDADGNVILQAPVIDNVYYVAHLDTRSAQIIATATKIVALDSNGAVIYTENIPQPARGLPRGIHR